MKPLRWHVCQAPVCKYPHYCYYNIRGGVSLMAWVSHWASHSLGIPAISAASLSMHIYKQENLCVKSLWVSCCLHQKTCLITRSDWFMFHRSYCKKSQLGSLSQIPGSFHCPSYLAHLRDSPKSQIPLLYHLIFTTCDNSGYIPEFPLHIVPSIHLLLMYTLFMFLVRSKYPLRGLPSQFLQVCG